MGLGASTPSPPSANGEATPTVEKSFAFKRVASVSDMSYVISKAETEPLRTGAIVPIVSFNDIEEDLYHVLEAFPRRPRGRSGSSSKSSKKTNGLIPTLTTRPRQSHSISLSSSKESTNVLNIVIMDSAAFDEGFFLGRIQEIIAEFVDLIEDE